MKHVDKALLILILFILVIITTNYIYGVSTCLTESYLERFSTEVAYAATEVAYAATEVAYAATGAVNTDVAAANSYNSATDAAYTNANSYNKANTTTTTATKANNSDTIDELRLKRQNNTTLLEHNSVERNTIETKLKSENVYKCNYKNGEFVSLTPANNLHNTYKIDENVHVDMSKTIKEIEFTIKYIDDYSSAKKIMPRFNCSNAYPFYMLVSYDNKLTIYNNNNSLIVAGLNKLQNVENIGFSTVSYKPIVVKKESQQEKQINLKLTTGGEEISINFNIDSKAYNQLTDMAVIQKVESENKPQLPIKNNCY